MRRRRRACARPVRCCVAKTTMPDYGMLSSGLSSFHETARNPWNLERTPGGSSAGAGAAAAAGYGPLHVGTDIGGSVRLPAGWCGVFGLKPSLGRIPIHPVYAGRVAGPMTRCVADAALMMGPLSRPDARDPTGLPQQAIEWMRLDRDVRGLRIGLWLDAGIGLAVDPQVRAAVEHIASALEAAGAVVDPVEPFLDRAMLDGMDDFWRMRSWLDLRAIDPQQRNRVLPYIVEWVRPAAGFDGARVFRGYSQMAALRDAALAACLPFDFVISPTAPIPAFAAELPSPTDDPQRPFEHIGFTLPFNMSEQPAASVNCGWFDDGMPIGLQVIGARHDDLGVLQLARVVEQLRGEQRTCPLPGAA